MGSLKEEDETSRKIELYKVRMGRWWWRWFIVCPQKEKKNKGPRCYKELLPQTAGKGKKKKNRGSTREVERQTKELDYGSSK